MRYIPHATILLVHRILVVEDDPRTAETIKLYLEHDGFDAASA